MQQTILKKNGLATHPVVKRQFAGADVSDGLQELCAKMSRSETSLFVELSQSPRTDLLSSKVQSERVFWKHSTVHHGLLTDSAFVQERTTKGYRLSCLPLLLPFSHVLHLDIFLDCNVCLAFLQVYVYSYWCFIFDSSLRV